MLARPPRAAPCRSSGNVFVHAQSPRAPNCVLNPTRGFSRTCRLRCRSSSGTARVGRPVGGANRRRNEVLLCKGSPLSAEVTGSSEVDDGRWHGSAAFEVEAVDESAALLSSGSEAAAQDGEWRSFGRDGAVERLSTSSSRGNGLMAFDDSLGTIRFETEFETMQSVGEWSEAVEGGTVTGEGLEARNAEGLWNVNGTRLEISHVPDDEEGVVVGPVQGGVSEEKAPLEQQKVKKRTTLGIRKPSQEPPARITPAAVMSPVMAPVMSPVMSSFTVAERHDEQPEPELQEDLEYFIPKVGDVVTGVVVSGNEYQLDIDIGAKHLGRLLSKDLKPLDSFRPDEFFWELGESGASMPAIPSGQVRFLGSREALRPTYPLVPVGTVFHLQVCGVTLSGRAVLSARLLASRIAWQRVRQIYEQNEPIEVQCVAWNSDGVVFKIEGLRAVLPLNEFLDRSKISRTLKDYVGEWITVSIAEVDEDTKKLVVSEKRAWGWRNLRIGCLVTGTVQKIFPYAVEIILCGTSLRAMLHISYISQCYVPDIASIFTAGETVKALVINSGNPKRIGLSTADLESSQGLMLRDRKRVFQEAEMMAARYRSSDSRALNNEFEENADTFRKVEEPGSANQDWLDFGDEGISPVGHL